MSERLYAAKSPQPGFTCDETLLLNLSEPEPTIGHH
jgi:hypothetical protein